jgi:hypothetical protein
MEILTSKEQVEALIQRADDYTETCDLIDSLIEQVTLFAFSVHHHDEKYKTELKIKALSLLKGVEVPVASAILALCYPEDYCVLV